MPGEFSFNYSLSINSPASRALNLPAHQTNPELDFLKSLILRICCDNFHWVFNDLICGGT